MIDPTVTAFYTKNPAEGYIDSYDHQHGARLDAMVEHYGLSSLRGQRVVDVGGGLGFLGKRLDVSNDYWVIDGAQTPEAKRLAKGHYITADIDRDPFGEMPLFFENVGWCGGIGYGPPTGTFDIGFCLEVLEHCTSPYNVLVEMKKLVKRDGVIILSIPTETVTHNVVYPALLWPTDNWEQFLGQMALPITDRWTFEPKPGGGWPAYHHRCVNASWASSVMLYHKTEPQFRGVTPLQATNL